LVEIINVDHRHRSDFFSPIKSAFDYFMQFHSDRFAFDSNSMRLRNLRRGELPEISLKDPTTRDGFYQDVENVLEAFQDVSIRDLERLSIEGQISLPGAVLRGDIQIVNRSAHPVDLNRLIPGFNGRITLENAAIRIGPDGQIERKTA
jgi:hypothetical protein